MRKYSFNGDDRLSPQLKLIFFFFLFFFHDVLLARMASIHCIEYWKRAVDEKVEITFFFPNSFLLVFLRFASLAMEDLKKKNEKSVRKRRHA